MARREDEIIAVGGDTGKARKELGLLRRGIDRTKRTFSGFNTGFARLDKAANGLIGRFNRLATAANGMRAAAAGAAIYGIARLGATFIGFDDKLRQAAAAMGATAKQFDNLKNKALEVSQATRFTARETAEALLRLGQAGLSAEESLEALPHTINLAAAGALDVGRAAEIMTDSMAAMGLGTSEAQRVADLLAKSAVSTATTVDQMGVALARAAPSARTLGISIEELVLELSILAKQGVKAELSATRIRALVNAISDPKIAQRLREQGVAVFDSQGAFVGLRNLMEQMNAAMAGLNDKARGDFLDLLQNVRAKEAVTSLAGLSPELIAQITEELEKASGAAAIQAKIMESGLGGAWRELKSSAEALIIQLIDKLAPALKAIINAFTQITRFATASIEAFRFLKPVLWALMFPIKLIADGAEVAGGFMYYFGEGVKFLIGKIGDLMRRVPALRKFLDWLGEKYRESEGIGGSGGEGSAPQKSFAQQKMEEANRLWDAHDRLATAPRKSPSMMVDAEGNPTHVDEGRYEAFDESGQIQSYTAEEREKALASLRKRAKGARIMSTLSETGGAYGYSHAPRGEEGEEVSEQDRERALERFADFSTRLADQAAKAEADRVAKIRSIEAIEDAERLLMAQARIERDRALAEEKQAYDLALAAAKAEQIEEIERRHKENLANLEIAHNERIAGIQSKAARNAAKLAEDKIATTQTLLGGVSSLLSVFGQQSDKAFKAWKAVAIAEAIISTYLAVDKALASGLGPPWTYIQAAAALAFGMANVARIRATKRDSGASSTSAASTPSASTGAVVTPATTGAIYAGRLEAVPGAARLERFTQGESIEAERQYRGDLKSVRVNLNARIGGQPLAVYVAGQEVQSDNS